MELRYTKVCHFFVFKQHIHTVTSTMPLWIYVRLLPKKLHLRKAIGKWFGGKKLKHIVRKVLGHHLIALLRKWRVYEDAIAFVTGLMGDKRI